MLGWELGRAESGPLPGSGESTQGSCPSPGPWGFPRAPSSLRGDLAFLLKNRTMGPRWVLKEAQDSGDSAGGGTLLRV